MVKKLFDYRSLGRLWAQFLPLSLSDITMALGDPVVTTTLANLPNSRENLAAVGTAKSLAIFFESPIIMVLHASNTMAGYSPASRALKKLTLIGMAVLSLGLVILSVPWVFSIMGQAIFGLSPGLSVKVREVLVPLSLWPAAIAWRRFYQGLLIRAGYAGAVAQAGVGRIMILVFLLAVGYLLAMDGARLAARAMIAGVVGEAILVTILAKNKRIERSGLYGDRISSLPSDLYGMWRFYWPLANSMVVVWGGRALLFAIIARAVDAPMALAVWPAAWGLVVLVSNATRMVQQVIIRNRMEFTDGLLLFFAGSVGLTCSLFLALLGYSHVGHRTLETFVGGDASLGKEVVRVVGICVALPLLISLQNALQGFLINEGRTKTINFATYVGTSVLIILGIAGVYSGGAGASVAALSMFAAIIAELCWLTIQARRWKPAN